MILPPDQRATGNAWPKEYPRQGQEWVAGNGDVLDIICIAHSFVHSTAMVVCYNRRGEGFETLPITEWMQAVMRSKNGVKNEGCDTGP